MGEKHRLWGRDSGRYFLPELLADLNAGHTIESTVYIQCGSAFRPDDPDELRPVGETEFAAGVAAEAEAAGRAGVCAGIVGYCDFRIGDRIDAVLEAHIQVGGGRFKGIRQSAGWDAAILTRTSAPAPAGLLQDPNFRAGLGRMGKYGLSYESSLYHPQLPELTALARAFPDLPILANHCGGPIRIGPHAERSAEVFAPSEVFQRKGPPRRPLPPSRPGRNPRLSRPRRPVRVRRARQSLRVKNSATPNG